MRRGEQERRMDGIGPLLSPESILMDFHQDCDVLQSVSKYTTLIAEIQSQHLRHALRPERRSKTVMTTSRQGHDMGFDGRCRH